MTSEPTPIVSDDDRMISATTSGLLNLRGGNVDQLSEVTGITRATLYRKLRHGRWSANETGAIARAFSVSVADLFSGRVTPGPPLPECAARDSNPEPAGKGPTRHLALVA